MRLPVISSALVATAVSLVSSVALGDVQHVVARGHTVDAIAHRYHVTVKSILDANHMKDANHLKVGETLTIPGVTPPSASGNGNGGGANGKKGKDGKPLKPVVYAMRAKTPGVIHATRLATSEDFTIKV